MAELRSVPQPVSEFHLPKGSAERRALGTTESLDVRFDVDSPGLIIVAAATGAWGPSWELLPHPADDARAPHRIELLSPAGAAVEQRTTEAPESNLVYELSDGFEPGRWTARLTNLGTSSREFGFYVSYPTARKLEYVDVAPTAFVELTTLRLEFGRGKDASRLEFGTAAGPVVHYFTVDEIHYRNPWMPRVVSHLENVRSADVTLSAPEGRDPMLRCELGFADDGVEISGTLALDLRDMRLTLDLPILVRFPPLSESTASCTVEFDVAEARATFSCVPRFEGLTEWMPGFFQLWRRSIERAVEGATRQLLATPAVTTLLSHALEARVMAQIGPNSRPFGVAATDGNLRFSYYTV